MKFVSWNAWPSRPKSAWKRSGTPSSGAMIRPTEPAEPSM